MGISRKGTYCLVLLCREGSAIRVGRLGRIRFRPGRYIYIGSALNGLEKRLKRHLKKDKKRFWHIDHLTSAEQFSIESIYVITGGRRLECIKAGELAGIFTPVPGFGCSDCGCESHLFFAGSRSSAVDVEMSLAGGPGFSPYTAVKDRPADQDRPPAG